MRRGLNNNIPRQSYIERFILDSPGISGSANPSLQGFFSDRPKMRTMFPAGFFSVPKAKDEVVIINPFNDGNQRLIAGIIPNYTFGLPPGSCMLYSDNAQVIVAQDGRVIINGSGDIKIQNQNGNITLNSDGVIDLN